MSELRTYRYRYSDNGFCRVYYVAENGAIVCFQEEAQGSFILYSCSRDGEPEAPYRRDWKGRLDKLPTDNDSTSVSFTEWVAASPNWTVDIADKKESP